MIKEFRTFLTRGSVIDLAVGFIMGGVFQVVVNALVKDIIMPLIAVVFGQPNFNGIGFTLRNSFVNVGDLLNAIVNLILVGAGVFFFIVKPVNHFNAMRARGQAEPDPTHKQCTECLSDIPVAATRCAFCAQPQTAVA